MTLGTLLQEHAVCRSRPAPRRWVKTSEIAVGKRRDTGRDSTKRRASNLGNLESLATSSPQQQQHQQQALVETWNSVDPSTLGPRMDSNAALPSLLLLALLIGLGGNRILGLERYFSQFARWLVEQRRYRERNKTIAARDVLERQFRDDGNSFHD